MSRISVEKAIDKRICSGCIGESFLAALVEKKGKRKKCTYCGVTGRTISLEELADKTETVIEQFYQRTPENPDSFQYAMLADKESDYTWFRDGDPITTIIEDLLTIDTLIAKDIQRILQGRNYDRKGDEFGEESEFDEEAHYEYVGVGSRSWEEEWYKFENSLKRDTRFFNQLAKAYLDSVFKDVNELEAIIGNPIMLVGPTQKLRAIYRARVFLSDKSLSKALANLVDELGPPPAEFAVAGRMNATGISAFYGATDIGTALAEVRPPVGSRVTIAKFEFTRELRLLNLIELQKVTAKGSLFDEVYADLMSRIQFLNQLCEKMTIPVMPGDEHMEYLVTQAVADFLAMDKKMNVDGIVFPSIQTKDGSNIVLFHKASRVVERAVPAGTKISVQLRENDEFGNPYESYALIEELPRHETEEMSLPTDADPRSPALSIDETSIIIHSVKAVEYLSDPNNLYIMRHKKMDFEDVFGRTNHDF